MITKEELENYVGNTISEKEFEKATEAYTQCFLLEETFCQDYAAHKSSKIIENLVSTMQTERAVLKSAIERRKNAIRILSCFVNSVERMRAFQSSYFQTKSKSFLIDAKQAERQVDAEINQLKNIINKEQL